jgi:hypothetical protein
MNLITNGIPFILEPLGGEDILRVMLGVDSFWYEKELEDPLTGLITFSCSFTYEGEQITLKRYICTPSSEDYYKIIIGSSLPCYSTVCRLKIEFEYLLRCHLL